MIRLALAAESAQLLHQVFEAAGLLLGARTYFHFKRRSPGASPAPFAVVVGCLVGAALGNKLIFWVQTPQLLPMLAAKPWMFLVGGQSMVGGLLGGLLGVELAKALVGHRVSTGDAFVMPILLGLAVGRVGCLLAGLQDGTHGLPSTLPWAVDYGDGVQRHPTPLYEIAWCGVTAWLLHRAAPRLAAVPGLQFKLLLWSYLLWRLGIEFLKPLPHAYPAALSGIQWVCLLALLVYSPFVWRAASALPTVPTPRR